MFDHPVQISGTASKLLSLSQGASTMDDYSIHFRILVANSGWNDTALRGVYIQGLAEELKDELKRRRQIWRPYSTSPYVWTIASGRDGKTGLG